MPLDLGLAGTLGQPSEDLPVTGIWGERLDWGGETMMEGWKDGWRME